MHAQDKPMSCTWSEISEARDIPGGNSPVIEFLLSRSNMSLGKPVHAGSWPPSAGLSVIARLTSDGKAGLMPHETGSAPTRLQFSMASTWSAGNLRDQQASTLYRFN